MQSHFNSAVSRNLTSSHFVRLAIILAACVCMLTTQRLNGQSTILQHAFPANQQPGGGVGSFASNTFKSEFDTEVQKHFDANKIPGMVVLMARDGMVTYRKTLGFADVENQISVTDKHVFRLASISKWVGGLMALKLEEQGMIDLNAKANSILTTIPDHHKSRVVDYLTCRAGIRHYNEPVSPLTPAGWSSTVYHSAWDALPFMWHDPLAVDAGTSHYSTHSYTFLGACLEQSSGKTIPQLVTQLLRNPHGLNTLRTENLSYTAANRVKLYGRIDSDNPEAGNQLVSADNLTWKFLGGGLESSGRDLLRLGMKVCDGQVISHDSLERMLDRIEPDSGYNLGCNTGVENGNRILAKDGGQTGASSYIWMAPDKRMVMVILTNIKQGKASTLGKKLRSIALGTTNAANQSPDLVVKKFSRTGTPYYQNGNLKIPFELLIENQGKAGTPNDFVNGVRLGTNYRWTRFMKTLPSKGKKTVTGTIKINDPGKLNQGRTLTFVATADAPIAAADTSIDPRARVFESVETNNSRILKVKVPGGIGGLQIAQPVRDPNLNPRSPATRTNPTTRTNPNAPSRTNPSGAKRANPKNAKRTNPKGGTRTNPSRTNGKPATKTAPAPTGSDKGKGRKKAKRANSKPKSKAQKSKPRRTNGKRPKIDKSQGETASKDKPKKKNR
ncbi:serine hydrolase [Mariniblastus fucicola]|uniref:Penicillin-binding protein 4 n=1 Tax=Mariniblastus fucicola TaxID=980251 RepID=A0A5B9PI12_9BACT|nr:serine hydrolase [Mariniblastus fucicola]QEG25259.1 Penicillin-binding protein 4* [Mariniblastus fucicola]